MFLTNDGRVVDKILNPKFGHERTYNVRVNKRITDSALNKMRTGVKIEGKERYITTKPATLKRLSDNSFSMVLTEGKKHQIRRMCSALGYTVVSLKRMRMMNLSLGNLPNGKTRPLTKKEKTDLLNQLELL